MSVNEGYNNVMVERKKNGRTEMNAIQFNQKDRSAELTIQQLAQTMRLGDSMGVMPKQVPVQPGELLVQMMEKLHEYTGLKPIEKPIVIREPYCQTNLNKMQSKQALDYPDYLIKRFVTKIELPMDTFTGPDTMRPGIALTYAYTDSIKGIQVAFGENVAVCDNLTAFGPYQFSTYGGNKVGFEEGMQLFNHWVQNLQTVHNQHISAIDFLMNTKVEKDKFHKVLGSLFEKAVRVNGGEKVEAPLNQTQVAGMVQKGLDVLDEQDTVTAWDIMNWGTFTLKPHSSDMIDLIKSTANFNDFILKEFNCPVAMGI